MSIFASVVGLGSWNGFPGFDDGKSVNRDTGTRLFFGSFFGVTLALIPWILGSPMATLTLTRARSPASPKGKNKNLRISPLFRRVLGSGLSQGHLKTALSAYCSAM